MTYKPGDKVTIINCSLSGRWFIEGEVTVLTPQNDSGSYLVDFGEGDQVVRFIDPAAQDDPAALIAKLNT